MNSIQIPVAIPQGMTSQSIKKITEQITMYAQFLFAHAKEAKTQTAQSMTMKEAMAYLESLSIKDTHVPADINGMKDICNQKYM